MKALQPLTLQDKYYLAIEAEIKRLLDDLIYKPLLDILRMPITQINKPIKNSSELRNSSELLRAAITNGTIWYKDGQFQGRFNARISAAIIRLGGIFNVRARTWSLPPDKLPNDLKFAQTAANTRYELMREQMLQALDNMDVNSIELGSRIKQEYEASIAHMNNDLLKTLPKVDAGTIDNPAVSRIVVEAKLTDKQREIIASDWKNNLDLYIKGWAQDNIVKLREEIQPHVIAGGRSEGLIKVIQDNYGVSRRKARFLARQETALLMAKFQETRYRDIGIEKYRWSTAHDVRVRHDHHELNGKVYRFDSPPVTNKKTGARNNPGQDFNCRCVAIPLVE